MAGFAGKETAKEYLVSDALERSVRGNVPSDFGSLAARLAGANSLRPLRLCVTSFLRLSQGSFAQIPNQGE